MKTCVPLPAIGSIKKRRSVLGLTQKNLADLCGLSQSVIAKVERGDVDPAYSTATKIFETLERLESRQTGDDRFLNLTARDLMTKSLISVKPTDHVSKARKLMVKHNISQLPVIDENAKLVGSLTEVQVLNQQESGTTLIVRDIMLDPFPMVSQNSNVSTIKSILLNEAAVLVSDHKTGLIGIITKYDLIKKSRDAN